MRKIIQYIMHRCWHKWETVSKKPVINSHGVLKFQTTDRCSKCGRWESGELA